VTANRPLGTTHDEKRLYRRVYDDVARRIGSGEWNPHDRLPSVRLLAAQFGMNRLTVMRAYRMLEEEGKIYAREKSGYYVSPASGGAAPVFSDSDFPASPPFLRDSLTEIQRLPVDYQFSQAMIDPNLLPNLFLSEYVKKVFDIYPKLMGTYSDVQGDGELREALARYLADNAKISLEASDLVITTGAQQAIDLLARLYVRPMDAILVERPTYSAALDIFRQQGARFLSVDIAPDGYDLNRVEELMALHKPRIFYLNPTFHNPTGYTVPAPQRKKLVELAERYRCLLIEDDSFHEMYFDAPPPPPFLAYDTGGWVVHLRSFSKYVSPGLRICAVAGAPQVMKPFLTAKSLADNGAPLVNQKIFLHYFESERVRRHLDKLRIALQVRKEIMEEELAAAPWTWVSPQGGLNLWLKLPSGLSAEALLEASLERSVSFVPGLICDPQRERGSWIRVSYSFVGEEKLREGARRLAELANRLLE
jgi:GntR family transcriptional regulator of abcA and norABC